MEILQFVVKNLNLRRKSIKAAFIVFILLSIVINLRFDNNDLFSWQPFISQIFYITIIYVWLYTAPKFLKYIYDLKKIYTEIAHYQELCNKLIDNDLPFRKINIVKIIYLLSWIFINAIFVYLNGTIILNSNYIYSNIFTFFLVLVGMILNTSSIMETHLYTYFLRGLTVEVPDVFDKLLIEIGLKENNDNEISNRYKATDLKYNKLLPSSTTEFQPLIFLARQNALVFLSVTLLYNLAYVKDIFFIVLNGRINEIIDNFDYFVVLSLLMAVVSFGSFLIIYIGPKVFLNRIFMAWKIEAIKELEDKINAKNNEENKDKLTQRLRYIREDRIMYDSDILSMAVIATTVLANIAAFIGLFIGI